MTRYYAKSNRSRRRYKKSTLSPYIKATAPAVGFLAAKAASMVAAKYLNTELKFRDTTGAQSPDNVNGQILHILNVPQGVANAQRVGSSLRVKSAYVQGRVQINPTAIDTVVKIFLVRDTQSQGNTPVYSSGPTGAGIYENATVDSWRNMNNTKRYQILGRRKLVLNTDYPEKTFSIFKKFYRGGQVKFYTANTGGASTDIQSGNLFLVMFSDETLNTPSTNWRSRVRYLDN